MENVKCCGTCVWCEIGNNVCDGIYCTIKDKLRIKLFQEPCEKYEKSKHPNAYIEDILFYE